MEIDAMERDGKNIPRCNFGQLIFTKRRLMFYTFLPFLGGILLVASWLNGKPISYWLRFRAQSGAPAIAARKATRLATAEHVPDLIKCLNVQDTAIDRLGRLAWTNLPSRIQRHFPSPIEAFRVRREAAAVLGEMGTNAVTAVSALEIASLSNDEVLQMRAAFALRMIQAAKSSLETSSLYNARSANRFAATNHERELRLEGIRPNGKVFMQSRVLFTDSAARQ